MKKHICILALITLVFSSQYGCKKADPDKKTSQDCMDDHGEAFYVNNDGDCVWAQGLTLMNEGNHWYGMWDNGQSGWQKWWFKLSRNGDETGGTGNFKTQCFGCEPESGSLEWKLSSSRDDVLLITSSSNSTGMFSQLGRIKPSSSANPGSFTSDVTSRNGTRSITFTLRSGSF